MLSLKGLWEVNGWRAGPKPPGTNSAISAWDLASPGSDYDESEDMHLFAFEEAETKSYEKSIQLIIRQECQCISALIRPPTDRVRKADHNRKVRKTTFPAMTEMGRSLDRIPRVSFCN